mmetsp:Transcript_5645/g.16677  ORF Transcript_5645/g.16677 Transcript_5645/m.16677 type:complete len:206 (+) Transcript_5645:120-737(+)
MPRCILALATTAFSFTRAPPQRRGVALRAAASGDYERCDRIFGVRAPVARGYGRGGKALGVPTANLDSDALGAALDDVAPGVYSCYAAFKPGDLEPAVVNVGFAPTFEGAEQPTKIVEAHLLDYAGGDFYDAPLALLLVAFQRPETKFDGLDALKAAIANDKAVAAKALAEDLKDLPYSAVQFLNAVATPGPPAAAQYFRTDGLG